MYEEVKVLTHSSIKIDGSLTVYFDPFKITEEMRDADLVLITHDHYDHYSPEDITKVIKEDTVLIAPECMKGQAEKDFGKVIDCRFILPGDMLELKDVLIKAVPAYNRLKPFHPKGKKYAGYVVTLDGRTYYVAGDTDDLPENQQIRCDVALVPAGGKFTMDYREAAKFVNRIKPRLAIPTHYGTVVGTPKDGGSFAKLVDDPIQVSLRL